MSKSLSADRKLSALFDDHAGLSSIRSGKDFCSFKKNKVVVETDYGSFDLSKIDCSCSEQSDERSFLYSLPFGTIELKYQTGNEGFIFSTLKFHISKALVIYKISNIFQLKDKAEKFIKYDTFRNASTVVFIRFKGYGIYTGFANPFFDFYEKDGTYIDEFKPSLIMNPGEDYISDLNFWSIYSLSGTMVSETIPQTPLTYSGRYFTRYRNPCGFIELDRREIRSFQKFSYFYLNPQADKFHFVFYTYFCPLPQLIKTDEEENTYYHYIDNFKSMGGDIIIFNPIEKIGLPTADFDSRWLISRPGSRTERILQYCRDKSIDYGFTWGSAASNTNSPMTSYSLPGEKSWWKKIGKDGTISRENCICSHDFYKWFLNVQKNTIISEKIKLWDWDPGPGNGSFCYSADHGHIPGLGAYKGFRDAMSLAGILKEECPGLYYQGFHGTKEYGLWGFKYFDQHEAYWEQDPYFYATAYPDLSEDRYTASGMRFQSWWNQNFRFLPAIINHSLSARMTQNYSYPQDIRFIFDFYGYKYGLMSGLAAGGSVTVPIIPYKLDSKFVGDYLAFFRKWIKWGKENFEYNRNTYAFGSQLVLGGIDGFSKIKGNSGFIFLGNSYPVRSGIDFEFGDEIGFEGKGVYNLEMIYPLDKSLYFDEKNKRGIFHLHDTVHVDVDPFQIFLFKIVKAGKDLQSFNLSCKTIKKDDSVFLDNAKENAGEIADVVIDHADGIKHLFINGKEVGFHLDNELAFCDIRFGEAGYPRFLTDWEYKGKKFFAPENEAMESSFLKTSFFLSEGVKRILDKGVSMVDEERRAKINEMRRVFHRDYAYGQPDRVYGFVSFKDANNIRNLKVTINGKGIEFLPKTMPTHCGVRTFVLGFLADVTDYLEFGKENVMTLSCDRIEENSFLGVQLYYLESELTSSFEKIVDNRHSLKNELPIQKAWHPASECTGKKPLVNAAWVQTGPLNEYSDVRICAQVNLPPDELTGVYCSNPVNIDGASHGSLLTDHEFAFDPDTKTWTLSLHMGSRQLLIIDEEDINIWAVSKSGFVSEAYKLSVDWKLY